MKVEEKLAVFSRVALGEAEQEARELIEGLTAELSGLEAATAAEAAGEAAALVAAEEDRSRHDGEKLSHDARQSARRKLADVRRKLTDLVFDEVAQMLADYRAGGKYGEWLAAAVRKFAAAFPGQRVIILADKADIDRLLAAAIEGVTVAVSPVALMGGFTAAVEGGKVTADCSFVRRYEDIKADINIFEGMPTE